MQGHMHLQPQVVGADEPGLLLLMDLRTRDLFEMKLDIETQARLLSITVRPQT